MAENFDEIIWIINIQHGQRKFTKVFIVSIKVIGYLFLCMYVAKNLGKCLNRM